MLDRMRSAAGSWMAKALLGLLLVSFAFFGVPQAFKEQNHSNDVLASGGSTVTPRDFQFAWANLIGRLPSSIPAEELLRLNMPQRVLQTLQINVILNEEARLMNIDVGEAPVLSLLGKDQAFHGLDGRFDKTLFLRMLENSRISQDAVFKDLAAQARRQQLTDSITQGVKPPETYYNAVALYYGETRNADYLLLEPSFIGKLDDPSEETLSKWYEENKEPFRAPEYRDVFYMQMKSSDLADKISISDDELNTYYEANKARYIEPEQRTFDILRFQTRAEADKAAAELKAGKSFDDLATEMKATAEMTRQGPVTRESLGTFMQPVVFSLKKGEISHVVNDLQGPVIIRIIDITAENSAPFDKIKDRLRAQLTSERAGKDLNDTVKTIENSRFEGASLEEVAKQYNFAPQTVTVAENGTTTDGKALDNLPVSQEFLPLVFKSEVDAPTNPIPGENSYIWYQVKKIIPARDRTLEEVRDQALAAWKEQETQRLLDEKAATFKKALDEGKPIADIAAANKLTKESIAGLQITKPNNTIGKEANVAIFDGPDGLTGTAKDQDGLSRIVFKVTSTAEPISTSSDALPQDEKQNETLSFHNDLLNETLFFALTTHPLIRNNSLIEQLINSAQQNISR